MVNRLPVIGILLSGFILNISGLFKKVGTTIFDLITYPFNKAFEWIIQKLPSVGHSLIAFGTELSIGLGKIGNIIFESITGLFDKGFSWISDKILNMGAFTEKLITAVGSIVGQLTSIIVKGLLGASELIFKALTNGFDRGFVWIVDKMHDVAKLTKDVFNTISGKSIEKNVSATYIPAVTVTPNGTKINSSKSTTKPTETTQSESKDYDKVLHDILNAINRLSDNLEAGRIGINMDGSLLSTKLARGMEFKGSFGTNR